MDLAYKSFCWSLGTTSFRMKNFNKAIEEQLALLADFWSLPDHVGQVWSANDALQASYYDFLHERGFVEGSAANKPKDAREKTSGLVALGLIDDRRQLTPVGQVLLELSLCGDFTSQNQFAIAEDSFLYLKQLLKTSVNIDGQVVRPFCVLIYLLNRFEYLTLDEFTYLLPLCIGQEETAAIERGIQELREDKISIDEIIISRLMAMDNYQAALDVFLASPVTCELVCDVGLNRKSRQYDKGYYALYQALYGVFVEGDLTQVRAVYEATKAIKVGRRWRNYLFTATSTTALVNSPETCLRSCAFSFLLTMVDSGTSEQREQVFKKVFFEVMHLLKAKATLADYLDLNRRYIKTTDVVLFEDGLVRLDIVPKYFFKQTIDSLVPELYRKCALLPLNCDLGAIASGLQAQDDIVIEAINQELGIRVDTLSAAREALEDARYCRLHHLIDTVFTDEALLQLLEYFELRQDDKITAMITDNADIPTLFEYVVGILWYKVSERQGKILDYMKLSLDADLLPKTHAGGGEADIVYEYEETPDYPAHALLLEATLADGANQRRMEMEPVSRHLGNYLLRSGNEDSYCIFVTNYLDINVISDFRGRKTLPFYDPQDYSRFVHGMKIIPLKVDFLRRMLKSKKTYRELYPLFEGAYQSSLLPHEWYEGTLGQSLD